MTFKVEGQLNLYKTLSNAIRLKQAHAGSMLASFAAF